MNQIAIVGRGYVGKAYGKLFPEAIFYDRQKQNKDEINQCDLAIISVPTPMQDNGSCDISIVEEVISWLKTPLILIKSTIPPGTTKNLKDKYHKRICHSPEYVGEGGYYIPFWEYPHPSEPQHHTFMIIGGSPQDREDILEFFYPILGPAKTYYQVDETTSELIKYFENCMIATKVTLCNEFYELAKTFGVSYSQVREGLVLDSRQGKMFTTVFKNKRGWSGKCLPKDLCALIKSSVQSGYDPKFIRSVVEANARFTSEKDLQNLPERIKNN